MGTSVSPCSVVVSVASALAAVEIADNYDGRLIALNRAGTDLRNIHAWWEALTAGWSLRTDTRPDVESTNLVPVVGGSGAHYRGVRCPISAPYRGFRSPLWGGQVTIIGGSGAYYRGDHVHVRSHPRGKSRPDIGRVRVLVLNDPLENPLIPPVTFIISPPAPLRAPWTPP